MLFLVAPNRFLPPDPATQGVLSLVTMPEAYLTGIELILFAAIVCLVVFALATPQSDRESLNRKPGRPRK
jgi:hypothetical protein